MIIAHINRFCSRHRHITHLFIAVVIILPFVFLYGDFGGSGKRGSTQNPIIGTMYGASISRVEFYRQLSAVKVKLYLQYERYVGTNDQLFRNEQLAHFVTKELFNGLRALHVAKDMNVGEVSPEEIKGHIREAAAFKTNDEFDLKKFNEFKDTVLKVESLSAKEFDEIVRDSIIVERIEQGITAAVVAAPAEAKIAYFDFFAKCKAQVANFYSYQYLNQVEVSEADVEKYFLENLETKYRVPEQRQLVVTSFAADDYEEGMEVREEEQLQYYNDHKAAQYTKKQYQLRHIQINAPTSDTPEQRAEKRKKLEDVLTQLTAAGDFDAMAAIHSEDAVSKNQGGDIGFADEAMLRARFSEEVSKTVAELPLDTYSGIVESRRGFHILKKTGERDEVPFEDVASQIKQAIKTEREEADAQAYYDENAATKYAQEEVHARHILIKTTPEDTEQIKADKRKKIEGILAEAREKNNFVELAQQHSEDASNAKDGGDLGYFGRGKMVPPFDTAAFAMKPNDISDVVETEFGYHIIQVLDRRDRQPFESVKNEVMQQRRKERMEKAKTAAKEDAGRFARAVYEKLTDVDNDKKADGFLHFAREYAAAKKALQPVVTDFITAEDTRVEGVPGSTGSLARGSERLGKDNPLCELIESSRHYYVACWKASKDGYLPKFREPVTPDAATSPEATGATQLTKQGRKAESDWKTEKATAKAREACWKAYADIKARLEEGKPLAEAKAEHTFTAVDEFPLGQGPRGANAEEIKTIARGTKANTLAAPKEIANGAILVYIEKHTLPSADEFATMESSWLPQFRQLKEQSVLGDFYKKLETESNTEFEEDWKFLQEIMAEDKAKTKNS